MQRSHALRSTFLLASLLVCGPVFAAPPTNPAFKIVPRGQISFSHPSFLALHPSEAGQQLVISSFGLFGGDGVSVVPNIGETVQRGRLAQSVVPLTRKVTWPNEVSVVGAPLFKEPGYLVAGGFLVPGKGTGALTYINAKTGAQTQITDNKRGYFYHRATPVHWGPSKSLALLTARANKPMFGSASGELVLLLPKGDGSFEEQVIAEGPDVFFQAIDLDGDGVEEVVTTNFFTEHKVELYWWEGPLLHSRTLDSSIGAPFDVQFADLQGNGGLNMVVTNHEGGSRGAVYAYEVPKNFKTEAWPRHTLLDNIVCKQGGPGAAAPGSATVFYPGKAQGKPAILVSGDGSQKAHLLTPQSARAGDWAYDESIIADVRGTVGKAAVGDVDGDGHPEIFVPAYDGNAILMFSVQPAR